jgi:hypothetical protein
LRVKMTPSPDVVDYDDDHYASLVQIPLPKMRHGQG